MDYNVILKYLPDFFAALLETVKIALISGIFAIAIGIVISIVLHLKNKVITIIFEIYTSIFRATPLLVQLYFIYYGLPMIGINIPPSTSAVLAFSLNTGAYVSEIMRGGLESIDRGQFMAATAMGMTFPQSMGSIIIPQVLNRILPSLITQISYLIKDTSLAAVLVVKELTYSYRNAASTTYRPFESLLVPMLFYFLLYLVFKIASNKAKSKGGAR